MIPELIAISAMLSGFIIAGISFYISTRYRSLSLSFVLLGAAFLSYGLAETYWYLLDSEAIEPYNTVVDLFYFLYYAFAILHVFATVRALKSRISARETLFVIMTIFVLGTAYGIFSIGSEDLYYGLFFVILSSILAGTALLTIIKMSYTILIKSWIMIGLAIFVSSVTDVWYYTQENITGYEYGEFPLMDTMWAATDILMIIGLILHRKMI